MNIRHTLVLAGLLAGLVPSTHAAPILSRPVSEQILNESKQFAINPELGRAWVEVSLVTSGSDVTENYQVRVPGLRYDASREAVVFQAEGQDVVCATVKSSGWWLFKGHRITPTGACQLSHRFVQTPVDNGFHIDDIQHFEVLFQPKT